MARLIMAVTTTCTRCPLIAAQLNKRGIPFDKATVDSDPELAQLLADLGRLESPVFLRVDDDIDATTAEHTYRGSAVTDHTGAYDRSLLQNWVTHSAAA